MSDLPIPAAALRAAVLKVLSEEVDLAITEGKADLKEVMDALGIKSLKATLPDGTDVATVTLAGTSAAPKVTDPVKYLAWVQENRPGEVEPVVRKSYTDALLASMKETGEPVDPETGEVVPGVEFRSGTGYLSVTFGRAGAGGRERIKQAWQNRDLDLAGLIALPAGSESNAAA